MKVRSITCFYNPGEPNAKNDLEQLAELAEEASRQFSSAGYALQSRRLATTPFPHFIKPLSPEALITTALSLEKEASQRGFQYLSLGPALPDFPDSYRLISPALGATDNVFFCGVVNLPDGISYHAVRGCAEIIADNARLEANGFTNLRFGAIANVGPDGPFLPASYHLGSKPAFALAIECADDAVQAFEQAKTLGEARQLLLVRFHAAAQKLSEICLNLQSRYGPVFKGLDMSPAPFPQDCCSLAGAIERLAGTHAGSLGVLPAAALVASALDEGTWLKTGFNGLMLPVLEDSVLARRSEEGTLELKDLLLYSAVCGAGLDTVPLPGDATVEQLAAVIADVAALAVRLSKPLIARLMPIPGKVAGEQTTFTFDFFANGRILSLPAGKSNSRIAAGEIAPIRPRV